MIEQEIAQHLYDLYQKGELDIESYLPFDRIDFMEISTKIQLPNRWFKTRINILRDGFRIFPFADTIYIASDLAGQIYEQELAKAKDQRKQERQDKLKETCKLFGLTCKE